MGKRPTPMITMKYSPSFNRSSVTQIDSLSEPSSGGGVRDTKKSGGKRITQATETNKKQVNWVIRIWNMDMQSHAKTPDHIPPDTARPTINVSTNTTTAI